MTINRTYAALATAVAAVALATGVYAVSQDTGDTAPADPAAPAEPAAANAQPITVKARDTAGNSMGGVAVRVVDSAGATVTSGTTDSSGQVNLTFDPAAGKYAVIADEPAGYHARDDKDGGASSVNGPNCNNVYLCIYLTATEVTNPDGTTSVTVELTNVRPEQTTELDDLWFEMTPPARAVDEESAVDVIEPSPDDLLIGTVDDDLIGREDSVTDPAALSSICITTQHQKDASGIWVRGEVYGVGGGWIFVEGPTINNGDPVQIPVEGGLFDAPLPINQYGNHDVTLFELGGDGVAPVDLLPTLATGPGTAFPVDADEGPIFDDECFDFAVVQTTTEDLVAQIQDETDATVDAFLVDFVGNHVAGDSAGLLDTLHPAIPLAFGEDVCTDYVERTTGSIVGATTLSVGSPASMDMNTPAGLITFPEAIPFTVEFILGDASTTVNDANLAFHDGQPRWLTTCGVEN